MYLATLPIPSLGLYPLFAESRFRINSVHSSSGIKCNDKVRDHEKIMSYMCLNKSHSQDVRFSAPTHPAENVAKHTIILMCRLSTDGTFMNGGDFVLASFTLTLHAVR